MPASPWGPGGPGGPAARRENAAGSGPTRGHPGSQTGGGAAQPRILRAAVKATGIAPISWCEDAEGITPPGRSDGARFAGEAKFAGGPAGEIAPLAPWEVDWCEPVALLVGNEGAGLPEEVERSADARIRIPMSSGVESLNAAAAAAVLFYEAARQRNSVANGGKR